MKLFIWNKDVMVEWMSGLGFAIAETEEQARELVKQSMLADKEMRITADDHRWPYGLDKPADQVLDLDKPFGCAIWGSS